MQTKTKTNAPPKEGLAATLEKLASRPIVKQLGGVTYAARHLAMTAALIDERDDRRETAAALADCLALTLGLAAAVGLTPNDLANFKGTNGNGN